MNSREHKDLLEQFEQEFWLYVDQDLPNEKVRFWEEKIHAIPELKELYDNKLSEMEILIEIEKHKLSSGKFEEMISKTFQEDRGKEKFGEKIKHFIRKFEFPDNKLVPKVALTFSFVIAAIFISFLSDKPNPVKNASNTIFNWNEESISQRVFELRSSINLLDESELKNEFIESIQNDPWKSKVYSIKQSIDKIEKEIVNDNL